MQHTDTLNDVKCTQNFAVKPFHATHQYNTLTHDQIHTIYAELMALILLYTHSIVILYVCDTIFAFYGLIDFFSLNPSLLLSWMFEHQCLDTHCFGCLICMCFVFLYLHLFSAVEHVSHGKPLQKYNHYYYHVHKYFVTVSHINSVP